MFSKFPQLRSPLRMLSAARSWLNSLTVILSAWKIFDTIKPFQIEIQNCIEQAGTEVPLLSHRIDCEGGESLGCWDMFNILLSQIAGVESYIGHNISVCSPVIPGWMPGRDWYLPDLEMAWPDQHYTVLKHSLLCKDHITKASKSCSGCTTTTTYFTFWWMLFLFTISPSFRSLTFPPCNYERYLNKA